MGNTTSVATKRRLLANSTKSNQISLEPNRPVTLKEIAKAGGVSRATVSAVLHGKEWVSEETRQKVQTVLREKGYQQHLIANSLSEHLSRVIGVVIGNIKNPFNTELLGGLQDDLERSGYFMILHTTDETYESEIKAFGALSSYELGGYVVAPVQEGRPHDHIRRLVDSGKLLISIGELADIETHQVDFDDQIGNRLAMDYLIERGHRRIACLAGAETSTFAKRRNLGYVESLMNHGIPVENSLLIRAGDTLAGGFQAAKELLTGTNPHPTALVCFNDLIAIGAYQAAKELGISIPQDLSIVGFDDCEMAAIMGPPLTTVATFPKDLGRQIAEIIFSVHESPNLNGFLHRRTHPRLIERESVRSL